MGTSVIEPVDTSAADAAAATALAAEGTKTGDTAADSGGAAPSGPPAKYELKVPEGSTADPALLERTAATARALGLTNEAAQTLLDSEVKNAATHAKALTEASTKAQTDLVDAWKPGGTEWTKQQTSWTTAAKADPDIGGEKFAQSLEKGQQALAKFGTPEFKGLLEQTGYGSHPEVLKFMAKIGRAMSEASLVNGGAPSSASPPVGSTEYQVEKLYGKRT